MNTCGICKSSDLKIIYNGKIRMGVFGDYSSSNHPVFLCKSCEARFIQKIPDNLTDYYESDSYRADVDGMNDIDEFFRIHDGEQARNIAFTGTDIFRNKNVMDIGCGGGSFLDLISGYSNKTIAIEPNKLYQKSLRHRKYTVFPYASDALERYSGKVDIACTFSVLEHIEDPLKFLCEINATLTDKGVLYLSTPNAEDFLLEAMPEEYAQFYYRKVHLWYFTSAALVNLLKRAGFSKIDIAPMQRFGLGNYISWQKNMKPMGDVKYSYITKSVDNLWKEELARTFKSDYLYARATK